MSKRSDADLLEDILISMKRVESYVSGLSYDDFIKDQKTQDAVIRNIEMIGEAVKKLSVDIKNKKQQIPWRIIAGIRNRLIHGYFGINIDIVWEVAPINIPELIPEIEKIKNNIG